MENFAGEVGVTKFDELPFGAYNDPITCVALSQLLDIFVCVLFTCTHLSTLLKNIRKMSQNVKVLKF